ncbi:hypothetical protein [Lentzea sp. NBRC 102530]|uniref:hypothetical protein n=1 Tax=Lentzea sp. NBRC 102530 TaxID=3032201 RepID=UPI0024A5A724|nr:hypothetical protein [Lentzea sp. NBRC 102530]GLY48049.1 hypothetical protein Lesp01_17050 [Lentzea sp. NBRC 102530]
MADKNSYESSKIDWTRLLKYAQRVASEAKLPPAPAFAYEKVDKRSVSEEITTRKLFRVHRETRYAVKETRTRVEVLGKHWVLDTRYYADEVQVTPQRYTELREDVTYALLPDGQLVRVLVVKEDVFPAASMHNTTEMRHRLDAFTDGDVMVFDYSKDLRNGVMDGPHEHGEYWRTDLPGRRLVRHAKGVGLTLALKDVLEGRQPQRV